MRALNQVGQVQQSCTVGNYFVKIKFKTLCTIMKATVGTVLYCIVLYQR